MARLSPSQVSQRLADIAANGGDDSDLPPPDRRSRSEELRLRGQLVQVGDPVLYDGREVTLLGPGRGQAWWMVAWQDDDSGLIFHATAHRSRLEAP